MRTHLLPPPGLACVMQDLKVVVLQRTVVSRFGCFIFEVWLLRFRVLGAPFSSFGCFVFEIWVPRFQVLGGVLRFRVLGFRNYLLLALESFASIGSIAVLKSGVFSCLIVAFSGGMGLFPNLQLLNEPS